MPALCKPSHGGPLMPRFLLEGSFDVSFYVFPAVMPLHLLTAWRNVGVYF